MHCNYINVLQCTCFKKWWKNYGNRLNGVQSRCAQQCKIGDSFQIYLLKRVLLFKSAICHSCQQICYVRSKDKCLFVSVNCCSYLGRKILRGSEEYQVKDTSTLVWPDYSYWTISYMLSYRGAWKLVQQNPLTKLVPVDEYLPIMFDKHPE